MRKLILYLLKKLNEIQMILQAKCLNVSRKIESPIKSIEGKTLVIVPHADDELIGCYQFIKTHLHETTLFYCNFLGSNYSEENENTRKIEFVNFCITMGVNYIIAEQDVMLSLNKVIDKEQPLNILLPSVVDWHHEHRKTNTLLVTYLEQHIATCVQKIIWYHISVPMYGVVANYACSMTRSEHNEKWTRFKSHYPSQQTINVPRFKLAERDCLRVCYAAETFKVFSPGAYLLIMKREQVFSKQFDELKELLSNYKKLVEQSTQIYKGFI